MKAIVFLCLLCIAFSSAEIFFQEEFNDGWENRWVVSKHKQSEGTAGEFGVSAGKYFNDAEADKGLQTKQDARFYQISSEMKEFSNKDRPLIVQYSVKHEQNIDCGGGYLKILPAGLDQENFQGDSKYNIMFGPDICGTTKRIPDRDLQVVADTFLGTHGEYYYFKIGSADESHIFLITLLRAEWITQAEADSVLSRGPGAFSRSIIHRLPSVSTLFGSYCAGAKIGSAVVTGKIGGAVITGITLPAMVVTAAPIVVGATMVGASLLLLTRSHRGSGEGNSEGASLTTIVPSVRINFKAVKVLNSDDFQTLVMFTRPNDWEQRSQHGPGTELTITN